MFSCCCARVDISWTPVCGCYLGSNRCNQTCLEESVKASEISYYEEAKVSPMWAIYKLLKYLGCRESCQAKIQARTTLVYWT